MDDINSKKIKVVGFLRGINVGGRHKVPMEDLRDLLDGLGFTGAKTILNSGNFVIVTDKQDLILLEGIIESALLDTFGFPVPVCLRLQEEIRSLVDKNPFANVAIHEDIRLNVTFLKVKYKDNLLLPIISNDQSFEIIDIHKNEVMSILDLSKSQTPKAMDSLEKIFGKNITTRNWNTVQKLSAL